MHVSRHFVSALSLSATNKWSGMSSDVVSSAVNARNRVDGCVDVSLALTSI